MFSKISPKRKPIESKVKEFNISKNNKYQFYLIGEMDIERMSKDELGALRRDTINKLADIQVQINKNNQKKWKGNKVAQRNLVILKSDKRHFQKILNKIDDKLYKI